MTEHSQIVIRIAGPQDIEALVGLLRERDHAEHPRDAVWSYLFGLDPQRIIVWIAEANGVPAAINAMYLRKVCFQERLLSAGYWAHLFVLPRYRKAMVYPRLVFTMLRWARQERLELVYTAMRRTHVTQGHLKLGFRQIGSLPVLMKPLRPASLLMKTIPGMLPLLPLATPVDWIWRSCALGRCSLGSSFAGQRATIEEIPVSASYPLFTNPESQDLLHTAWDADTWTKRFKCTIEGWRYQTHVANTGQDPLEAGILSRVAERGQGRIRALVVMDLTGAHVGDSVLRQLLLHAEFIGWQQRADLVLLLQDNDDRVSSVARRCGFWRSPETYTMIIWTPGNNNKDTSLERLENWSFSFADHDAF